jgi:hypothetical protein
MEASLSNDNISYVEPNRGASSAVRTHKKEELKAFYRCDDFVKGFYEGMVWVL